MERTTHRSLVYYRFRDLLPYPDLAHGVFTRLGGHSRPPFASLNTGHTVGDDPAAVEANHRLICQALEFRVADIVSPHQVHSATVRIVDERDKGRVCPRSDALVTATPGVLLMLRFADCVPVLLFDPVRRVMGLAHAGWRGTVAGVTWATVETMVSMFGCRPSDIICGIGPAIGPCCYEVGEEVAQAFHRAFPDASRLLQPRDNGRWHLDLWAANRHQVAQAGVRQVNVAGLCTACNTAEWYSHRVERGKTGRLGALIGLRRPST
jgi:YfiH family protein